MESHSEQAYERALGRLARYFSILHYVLERFSWRIWRLRTEFAHILTKDLPIKQLSEKVRASFKEIELDQKIQNELRLILRKVEKLAQTRNDLLHALWKIEDGKPVEFRTRRDLHSSKTAPTPGMIDDLSESMLNTAMELLDFQSFNLPLDKLALGHKRKAQGQRPTSSK